MSLNLKDGKRGQTVSELQYNMCAPIAEQSNLAIKRDGFIKDAEKMGISKAITIAKHRKANRSYEKAAD